METMIRRNRKAVGLPAIIALFASPIMIWALVILMQQFVSDGVAERIGMSFFAYLFTVAPLSIIAAIVLLGLRRRSVVVTETLPYSGC